MVVVKLAIVIVWVTSFITDSRGGSHATERRAWEPGLLLMAETKINAVKLSQFEFYT